MAVTSGFFNSVNGDRTYDADDMSNYFKGLLTDGVFASVGDAFEVEGGTGLGVVVGTGRGLIDCKWINSDTAVNKTIPSADPSLSTYHAVILRLNRTNRAITIELKSGTPASTPVKPSMEDSASIKELALAYILVPAGATSISQCTITDARTFVYANVTANVLQLNFYKTANLGGTTSLNQVSLNMAGYEYSESDSFIVGINGLMGAMGEDYQIVTGNVTPYLQFNNGVSGEVSIHVIKTMAY